MSSHHQTFVHEPLGEKEGSNRRNNSSRRSSADDKDVAYSSLPYVKSRAGEERREMEGFQKSSNPFPAAPLSASSIFPSGIPPWRRRETFPTFRSKCERCRIPPLSPCLSAAVAGAHGEKNFSIGGEEFFSITCAWAAEGWVGRWAPAGCGILGFGFIKSTYFWTSKKRYQSSNITLIIFNVMCGFYNSFCFDTHYMKLKS